MVLCFILIFPTQRDCLMSFQHIVESFPLLPMWSSWPPSTGSSLEKNANLQALEGQNGRALQVSTSITWTARSRHCLPKPKSSDRMLWYRRIHASSPWRWKSQHQPHPRLCLHPEKIFLGRSAWSLNSLLENFELWTTAFRASCENCTCEIGKSYSFRSIARIYWGRLLLW